jgi:hypothetical protein
MRVLERGKRGRRVVEDVELPRKHELAQARLCLVARPARREAEVELRRRFARHDVLRNASGDAHDAQHLAIDEAVELDVAGRQRRNRGEPVDERMDRIAPRPRPG